MCAIFLVTFVTIFYQPEFSAVSPDGKFKVTVEVKEEDELQKRYITKLTNNASKETIEIANCVRRDLPNPNFYWDKDSNYLIFEQCSESFVDSRIKIFNLKTNKIDIELVGLIGNHDASGEQFDSDNGILFYFDTSADNKSKVPDLWAFNITTKERVKLFEFETRFNMDIPEIKRSRAKREITIKYFDIVDGQRIKQMEY